jgi:hypothetical protein
MLLLIENSYSDGHESQQEVTVEEPDEVSEADMDMWFQDVAYEFTGDGHGVGTKLGSCYTVTIMEAENPALVGLSEEWID